MNDITMITRLDALKSSNSLLRTEAVKEKSAATIGDGKSFGQMLTDAVKKVNESQVEADSSVKNLLSGNGGSLTDAIVQVEKAEVSFRLMNQVKNKIVDAYKEIMRMQV